MSRIAVFFAEGFEEVEALTVVDICRRAGVNVDMVSVSDKDYEISSHKVKVGMDQTLSSLDWEGLDMMVLPGGMPGTLNLEATPALMEKLDAFYEAGKWVAAICAAPSIFGHRGYLKGKKACCYPSFESHLEGADVSKNPAEKDGNVITSRGMGTAIAFGLTIVEALTDAAKAEEVAKSIVYR